MPIFHDPCPYSARPRLLFLKNFPNNFFRTYKIFHLLLEISELCIKNSELSGHYFSWLKSRPKKHLRSFDFLSKVLKMFHYPRLFGTSTLINFLENTLIHAYSASTFIKHLRVTKQLKHFKKDVKE